MNRFILLNMDLIKETTNHDLLLRQFNEYAFVGGMPEALSIYLKTGSYSMLREIYDAIFMGYLEDVEKYSNLDPLGQNIGIGGKLLKIPFLHAFYSLRNI